MTAFCVLLCVHFVTSTTCRCVPARCRIILHTVETFQVAAVFVTRLVHPGSLQVDRILSFLRVFQVLRVRLMSSLHLLLLPCFLPEAVCGVVTK